MEDLNCLSPEQLAILANLVALELSKGKSANELNVFGNFIVAIRRHFANHGSSKTKS